MFLFLVHGDMVVVELFSENNWAAPSNAISYGSNATAEEGLKKFIYAMQAA